jgi:5-methylcytosine-specific restriction enzyme A
MRQTKRVWFRHAVLARFCPAKREKTLPSMPHRHGWYCTAGWQRRRAHQLMIEPLCRLCLEAGRVTPATVADHITPHRGDYTVFRLGQLRSLCADCHNRLDGTNSPRAPIREDGTPSDPNHPWKQLIGGTTIHRSRPS